MTYISEEVRGQVAALEAREKALATRAKRLFPVWMGLAGATCATSFLARFLGPDEQPSSIDVPAKVLELFSATVPSSGGGLPYQTGLDALGNAVASMSTVLIGLGLVAAIIGAGLAFMGGDRGSALKLAFGGMLLPGAVMISSSILGDSVDAEVSPRVIFMEAVEKHRYSAVLEHLKAVELDATTAGIYVLAQVAIAKGDEATTPARKDYLARAIASPQVGPGFTPKGEALYAIEHAAYGHPKSPAAIAYQDERQARQGWARMGTIILGVLSMATGGVALSFLALRRALGQRVRRIEGLLGPDNKPMEAELKR